MRPLKGWILDLLRGWSLELYQRLDAAAARQGEARVAEKAPTESAHVPSLALDRAVERDLGESQPQDGQPTELLYHIAHEIKAPLTAIIYSSELLGILERLDSSPDTHKEALIQNISSNAWKVNRRVTQVLDFMKARNGDLKLEPQSLEIGPVITDVASQLLVLFSTKGQSLNLEVPDSLPMIRADKARLEQVLSNLLENANELSPDETNVTVTARKVGKRIVVEVRDSGPAITDGNTGKLFDLCHAGDDTNGRQPLPPLDPGLAISKRLVELHHGEIWVESEPGKGNTFAFSLPALNEGKKPPKQPKRKPKERSQGKEGLLQGG